MPQGLGHPGHHSNRTLTDPKALGLRSYISEPDGGRRCWRVGQDSRCGANGTTTDAGGVMRVPMSDFTCPRPFTQEQQVLLRNTPLCMGLLAADGIAPR